MNDTELADVEAETSAADEDEASEAAEPTPRAHRKAAQSLLGGDAYSVQGRYFPETLGNLYGKSGLSTADKIEVLQRAKNALEVEVASAREDLEAQLSQFNERTAQAAEEIEAALKLYEERAANEPEDPAEDQESDSDDTDEA